MENKYYNWLVGDRKHFPKMELPEVENPMIFKDLETPKIAKQESEEAEIDEGGEEITKEDEEKINDAIDTEDLGARADMEWSKEKDERAINN